MNRYAHAGFKSYKFSDTCIFYTALCDALREKEHLRGNGHSYVNIKHAMRDQFNTFFEVLCVSFSRRRSPTWWTDLFISATLVLKALPLWQTLWAQSCVRTRTHSLWFKILCLCHLPPAFFCISFEFRQTNIVIIAGAGSSYHGVRIPLSVFILPSWLRAHII